MSSAWRSRLVSRAAGNSWEIGKGGDGVSVEVRLGGGRHGPVRNGRLLGMMNLPTRVDSCKRLV